ncbi:MAG: hypothetical protein HC914_16190 [Chloroflexaceae bacterium]|nr:hypothetical protein [Chloroflexaceae bacterium]
MSGYTFPYSDYDEANGALICVPVAFVPFLRRSWEVLQARDTWFNQDSWWRAYQVSAWLEEQSVMSCLNELVQSNERIYRLLDRAINGTAYTATPDPLDPEAPPTITPEIPDVPRALSVAPGLLARFERLLRITDNFYNGRPYPNDTQNPAEPSVTNTVSMRQQLILAQGIIDAGWFGIGGKNATIADVVEALRIGDSNQSNSLFTALQDILSAAGNVASIASILQNLLTDTVSNVREGSLQGVLIASVLANTSVLSQIAASQAQQDEQITLILEALRGTNEPTDNILQALRGDLVASSTRNVIDSAGGGEDLIAEVDQVEELLVGISQLLGGTQP